MKWVTGKAWPPLYIGYCAVALISSGCAQPQSEATASRPALPVLSLAAEREKADADQIYTTCLLNAAHYMDDEKTDSARIAIAIAPMCYPQFKRFEAAATVGLNGRGRLAFDRTGDQLQLDRANDILRKIRGETASADNKR